MKHELEIRNSLQSVTEGADPERWKELGAELGRAHVAIEPLAKTVRRPPNRRRMIERLIAREAANPRGENATWVLDNYRLIFGAEKDARRLALRLSRYPVIATP